VGVVDVLDFADGSAYKATNWSALTATVSSSNWPTNSTTDTKTF